MRREAKGKRVKQTLDVLIILCGAGAVFLVFKEIGTWRFAPAVYFVIVIGMAAAIYDLFRLSGSKNTEEIMPEAERIQGIQRLILLDEEGNLRDYHYIFSYWKKWMPLEKKFEDLSELGKEAFQEVKK